eukprot:8206614-Ditylum_brightwellii.AAC.1
MVLTGVRMEQNMSSPNEIISRSVLFGSANQLVQKKMMNVLMDVLIDVLMIALMDVLVMLITVKKMVLMIALTG